MTGPGDRRAEGVVVFEFEDISSRLEVAPLGARRALDHVGLRLPAEGWRSLPVEERRRIAIAGMQDTVDSEAIDRSVRMSVARPTRIAAVADPDPLCPPAPVVEALRPARHLDARAWVRLRPVERYALAVIYRHAVARDDLAPLELAFDVFVRPDREGSVRPRYSSRPPVRSSSLPPGARSPSSLPPVAVSARSPSERPISTHLSETGHAQMVDVGDKPVTARRAAATGRVRMRPETAARIQRHEVPKGEVLGTARIAAIMAAKKTQELIPLCHQVALTNVTVHLDVDVSAGCVNVMAIADTADRTGVEMEALTAVSVACLTVYDMLKGVDRDMTIGDIALLEKSGGRSGHYRRDPR